MEADNAGSKLLAERKLTEDCALPIAELAESEAIRCLHLARIESRYVRAAVGQKGGAVGPATNARFSAGRASGVIP